MEDEFRVVHEGHDEIASARGSQRRPTADLMARRTDMWARDTTWSSTNSPVAFDMLGSGRQSSALPVKLSRTWERTLMALAKIFADRWMRPKHEWKNPVRPHAAENPGEFFAVMSDVLRNAGCPYEEYPSLRTIPALLPRPNQSTCPDSSVLRIKHRC